MKHKKPSIFWYPRNTLVTYLMTHCQEGGFIRAYLVKRYCKNDTFVLIWETATLADYSRRWSDKRLLKDAKYQGN